MERNAIGDVHESKHGKSGDMVAFRNVMDRIKARSAIAGAALLVASGVLLLATELPAGLSGGGGASAALAELAARSPGMRIGGVALKAKSKRAHLAPAAAPAAPAPGARPPVASVMGVATGPVGAVPGAGAIGPSAFPQDFLTPGPSNLPAAGASPPIGAVGVVPLPPVGSPAIIVPGGPGGGGVIPPGGGTLTPPPDGGETVTPPPVVVVPPPVTSAVPEPSTWLLLIVGLGYAGRTMRQRRRAQLA